MTAQRRIRKTQRKRSTTDVDPYTERYRKASDGAKAARASAGRRTGQSDLGAGVEAGRGLAVQIGEGSRITGVSLVAEGGTGYIISVGEETQPAGYFRESTDPEDHQGVVPPAAIERATSIHFGYGDPEEAVRKEAASHAAPELERGASGASGSSVEGDWQEVHKVFFEKEVNLIPTHVGTELCACTIGQDHWVELGEN